MATADGEFYRDKQDKRDGQDFLMGDFWIPARQRRIYDFRGSIRVVLSSDIQAARAYSAIQGVPRRATAFSCSSSFRITATRAPFLALPR